MNNAQNTGTPRRHFWPLALASFFLLATVASSAQVSSTNLQTFQARGIVREIAASEKTVGIQHDAIPGYMPAMTMPFEVKDVRELAGIAPGDSVAFQIEVTPQDGWIEHLRKIDPTIDTNIPTTGPFRLVRDVEPLKVGDLLPDYEFTNELGHAVRLSSFRGQALAITFIFTRCPYPTFCPRMSDLFHDTLATLAKNPSGPTNYHFLTVSFDPDFDTPETLKNYALFHQYDPARWSFLTGQLIEITALADSFGMKFWHEGAGINHNLRTAVVDARGRVQKVLIGNKWTAEMLAAETVTAAREQ